MRTSEHRKKQLVRLLRRLRSSPRFNDEHDEPRVGALIDRVKHRLGYDQECYSTSAGEAYARVMWM